MQIGGIEMKISEKIAEASKYDYGRIEINVLLDLLESEIEKFEVDCVELQTNVVEMDIVRSCIEEMRE